MIEHYVVVVIMLTFIITGFSMLIIRELNMIPPTGLHGVHMLCSGLFAGLAVFHLVYNLGLRRRTRIWITKRDVKDTIALTKYYLGLGEMPKMGFHNPGEKILVYWFMGVTCMLVMGLAGYIRLWFGNPPWAVMLHDACFTIIAAVLLLHFYMAVFYREHRPLLHAMFIDGKVPAEYVKDYMPLWYQELSKRKLTRNVEHPGKDEAKRST